MLAPPDTSGGTGASAGGTQGVTGELLDFQKLGAYSFINDFFLYCNGCKGKYDGGRNKLD